jgi:hypothetical protein
MSTQDLDAFDIQKVAFDITYFNKQVTSEEVFVGPLESVSAQKDGPTQGRVLRRERSVGGVLDRFRLIICT